MANNGSVEMWAQAQSLLDSWDSLSNRFAPLLTSTMEDPLAALRRTQGALVLLIRVIRNCYA